MDEIVDRTKKGGHLSKLLTYNILTFIQNA